MTGKGTCGPARSPFLSLSLSSFLSCFYASPFLLQSNKTKGRENRWRLCKGVKCECAMPHPHLVWRAERKDLGEVHGDDKSCR